MLAGIIIYVLTLDERFRAPVAPSSPVPNASPK
jgi:hypothetical protein